MAHRFVWLGAVSGALRGSLQFSWLFLTGQNPWFYLAGGPRLSQHRHISEFHSSWTLDPSLASDLRRRTETTPGKHSDARIKPLPLTNGHGRYITAAPERALVLVSCIRWGMAVTCGRYKFATGSLPKRFRNGRFTSKTAVRRFQK